MLYWQHRHHLKCVVKWQLYIIECIYVELTLVHSCTWPRAPCIVLSFVVFVAQWMCLYLCAGSLFVCAIYCGVYACTWEFHHYRDLGPSLIYYKMVFSWAGKTLRGHSGYYLSTYMKLTISCSPNNCASNNIIVIIANFLYVIIVCNYNHYNIAKSNHQLVVIVKFWTLTPFLIHIQNTV